MVLSEERIAYLLGRYSSGKSTKPEEQELFQWIMETGDRRPVEEHIQQLISEYRNDERVPVVEWEALYQKILADKSFKKPVAFNLKWVKVAAAASIIALLGAGSYFLFFNKLIPQRHLPIAANASGAGKDIAPGRNKAILTLSNGSQIILDSAANGTLAKQGNAKIIKLNSGQLVYNGINGKAGDVLYNTISTPKGGSYQITLEDGSKVWLNAASSLEFPTVFSGKERIVKLTGEGYFEIAPDAAKPFKVSLHGMEVQVLGTHFNINAYDDEASIKTTLLQGSVKLVPKQAQAGADQLLKPGEQAVFSQTAGNNLPAFRVIHDVDVDQVVAWKDGYFVFDNTDLHLLMREVTRWYDVDVNYEGKVTEDGFTGKISRNEPLSRVLKVLELNEVHIRTEGRKITVMP